MKTGLTPSASGRPGRKLLNPRHAHRPQKRQCSQEFRMDSMPGDIASAVAALHDSDPQSRLAAVWTLGQGGALQALPDLLILLYDGDPDVQEAVKTALLSFGLDAQPCLENILAESDNPSLLWAAMKALLMITA